MVSVMRKQIGSLIMSRSLCHMDESEHYSVHNEEQLKDPFSCKTRKKATRANKASMSLKLQDLKSSRGSNLSGLHFSLKKRDRTLANSNREVTNLKRRVNIWNDP